MDERRELFEKWAALQFPIFNAELSQYDEEEGYVIPIINALWMGFNAGVELS